MILGSLIKACARLDLWPLDPPPVVEISIAELDRKLRSITIPTICNWKELRSDSGQRVSQVNSNYEGEYYCSLKDELARELGEIDDEIPDLYLDSFGA